MYVEDARYDSDRALVDRPEDSYVEDARQRQRQSTAGGTALHDDQCIA